MENVHVDWIHQFKGKFTPEFEKVLPNDDYHLIRLIAWRHINKISNGKLGLKSHLFLWVIDLSNTKHRIPDKKA